MMQPNKLSAQDEFRTLPSSWTQALVDTWNIGKKPLTFVLRQRHRLRPKPKISTNVKKAAA